MKGEMRLWNLDESPADTTWTRDVAVTSGMRQSVNEQTAELARLGHRRRRIGGAGAGGVPAPGHDP